MLAIITGGILLIVGIVLAVGGVWLAAVGGSGYYLIAAIGFLLTGALLVRRNVMALWIYAAVVIGTLAWALWEVGLDWWALVPRCSLIVLIGLWLVTPWVTRSLGDPTTTPTTDDTQHAARPSRPLWLRAGVPWPWPW